MLDSQLPAKADLLAGLLVDAVLASSSDRALLLAPVCLEEDIVKVNCKWLVSQIKVYRVSSSSHLLHDCGQKGSILRTAGLKGFLGVED